VVKQNLLLATKKPQKEPLLHDREMDKVRVYLDEHNKNKRKERGSSGYMTADK
jgi:hypothetical protein